MTFHRFFIQISSLDALDTGSNKSAIVSCNKLLKKHPKSDLVKVRHLIQYQLHT